LSQKKDKVKIKCIVCSAEKFVYPYRKNARFCSRKCASKFNYGKGLAKIDHSYAIGNKFRQGKSPSNKGKKLPQFSGRNHPRWKEPISFTCVKCKKEFKKKPWEVNSAKKYKGNPPQFCSRICMGGDIPLRKKRLGKKSWLEVSKFVKDRDGFMCQLCGKTNCKLNAHHMIPFKETQDDSPDNLVTLCVYCHTKIEKDYSAVQDLKDYLACETFEDLKKKGFEWAVEDVQVFVK
jgi:5-methylcytosine-specific restriction endonuclease McrA